MSEENENGEENPPKEASESDEFDFYFSFTKPLVLDLPSSEDKAIAAAWVQKLEAEPETEEEKQLRINYLKLLLFVLQRGRLSGIFKKQPPSGPLQPFPQGFSIIDMGNWMLDQDDGQPCGGGDARSVPYTIEISNDLREFVASQEIPNFGIQMYYAWSSDDPIHKWISFDEDKFPQFILDKIKQLKEVKSDEKSNVKCGSVTKKKLCDFSLPDKYSKKKVKSPQEIERSQGRSFHTYMGLVGRMGNFNDKCDDDPEKYQRQSLPKGKCPRRAPQKRCPGNGGEADDMMMEEEFDNLVTGLGGLGAQNRLCNCGNPCQHQECPEHPKGGQPQSCESQPPPGRNGYNMRADVDNNQCQTAAPQASSRRRVEEPQCPDTDMSQMAAQQRCPGNRSRSNSPGQLECPPEDNSKQVKKQAGVCICSSPPCTCPCPRGDSSKATSNANFARAGGRQSPEQNRCPPKPAKQDMCGPENYRNRPQAPYNNCMKTPDNYSSNNGSRLGACGGSPGMSPGRPGQTEVLHCYDTRNVDPSLYERIDKQYMDVARETGNRNFEANYQNCLAKDQLEVNQMPQTPARRPVFKPLAQSTPIMPDCSPEPRKTPPQIRLSPPQQSPVCDTYSSEDSQQSYSTSLGQQMNMGPQQYQQGGPECEDESRMRSPEPCPRQKPDCFKKPPPPKSSNCFQAAGGNENGRMANMASVLQGMKQRTEAHREKCDPAAARRSPPNDGACYPANAMNKSLVKARQPMPFDNGAMLQSCNNQPRNGRAGGGAQMYYSPQPKPTQQYSPCPDRGYSSYNNGMPNKQCMTQRQPLRQPQAAPDCYQPRQMNFDECDTPFEDDECDGESPDNIDPCSVDQQPPCPAPMQQPPCPAPMQQPPCPTAMQQPPCPTPMQQQPCPPPKQQPCPPPKQQPCPPKQQPCPPPRQQPCPTPMQQQPCPTSMQQQPCPTPMQQQPCPTPMQQQPCPTPMQQQPCPRGMPRNAPQNSMRGNNGGQECNKQLAQALQFAADSSKDDCGPQWASMNSNEGSPPRDCQTTLVDVLGRPIRNQRGSPQGGSQRCITGSTQDSPMSASTRDCLSQATDNNGNSRSRQSWPSRSSPGSRTPEISWATPPCAPADRMRSPARPMKQDCPEMQMAPCPQQIPRFQQQIAPCPPSSPSPQNPPCPQQSAPPCPRQSSFQQSNGPCPQSNGTYAPPNSPCPQRPASYASQSLNAGQQYQDEFCEDDMGQDFQNMDISGKDDCDRQTYSYGQDDICDSDLAGDAYNNYGDDCNQDDSQNLTGMTSLLEGAEECYDDFQDMSAVNCEPMGPSTNLQINISMGGRNGPQPQRGCNQNGANNRTPNFY